MSENRTTLYEETGLCPLELWTTYSINRNCFLCPLNNGVDVGVGFITYCDHRCRGKPKEETDDVLY